MYAIVKTGGKQYRVAEGDVLNVEKLDAEIGAEVSLDVLMLVDGENVVVGKPVVADANVVAKVVEHGKGEKVIVFKYKPKKDYRKKQGHRQPYTKLEIVSVSKMTTVILDILPSSQNLRLLLQRARKIREPGSDIVCAGISAILQTAYLGLTRVAKLAFAGLEMKDGEMTVVLERALPERERREADIILETMRQGLLSLKSIPRIPSASTNGGVTNVQNDIAAFRSQGWRQFQNGRDSHAQRLGAKRGDGQFVLAGNIPSASAERRSIPERTWASAATIPSLPRSAASCALSVSAATGSRSASIPKRKPRPTKAFALFRAADDPLLPFIVITDGKTAMILTANHFNLERTLNCGQAFRWKPQKDGCWFGVALDRPLLIRQVGDTLDLSASVRRNSGAAISRWTGITASGSPAGLRSPDRPSHRLQRRDEDPPSASYEALISFVVPQNNNVKRITGIIEACAPPMAKRAGIWGWTIAPSQERSFGKSHRQRAGTAPERATARLTSSIAPKESGTGMTLTVCAPFLLSRQKRADGPEGRRPKGRRMRDALFFGV